MSETDTPILRFPLLDALRDLGKRGAAIEASVLTTFTFDAAFYEEVLLRAFERAGSRLNTRLKHIPHRRAEHTPTLVR